MRQRFWIPMTAAVSKKRIGIRINVPWNVRAMNISACEAMISVGTAMARNHPFIASGL